VTHGRASSSLAFGTKLLKSPVTANGYGAFGFSGGVRGRLNGKMAFYRPWLLLQRPLCVLLQGTNAAHELAVGGGKAGGLEAELDGLPVIALL
jgi:hypothetical protein